MGQKETNPKCGCLQARPSDNNADNKADYRWVLEAFNVFLQWIIPKL